MSIHSRESAAFESAKRACYAGLGSVELRTEVVRRMAAVVPTEAYSFATTDPGTGLLIHAVAHGLPPALAQAYVQRLYPFEEAVVNLDAVRAGETILSASDRSETFRDVLRREGFRHEVNTLAFAADVLWGAWCMLRETGSPPFADRELRLMRRIAPHLARGLKLAALRETAAAWRGSAAANPAETGAETAPGVLVLDARARVAVRNGPAVAHLADVADVGMPEEVLPYAVASVLLRLLRARSRGAEDPAAPGDAELRIRGRSGGWYALSASLAEPDASGETSTIVVIEPLARREVAPILARLYGLSEREREVLALLVRGESTKRIAARLGLSVYTVQEHVGRACEKVGVRGRRALIARVFFDGYAPRL